LYSRTEAEFTPGNFRIKGDILEIFPSYGDEPFRIHFFGDEIEEIEAFDARTAQVIERYEKLTIYPANIFVTSQDKMREALVEIQGDMIRQCAYFRENGGIRLGCVDIYCKASTVLQTYQLSWMTNALSQLDSSGSRRRKPPQVGEPKQQPQG
jgi:transcription-repair coupling factor (superfamily II helicase)